MKYCTNCGKELRDEDIFCTECGHSTVKQNRSAESEEPKTETPTEEVKKVDEDWLDHIDEEDADDDSIADEPVEKAEPKVKKTPAKNRDDLSFSLILGVASIITAFIPAANMLSPILGFIGIILGIKEIQAGGRKIGLVLNIIGTACFVIPTVLALIATIFSTIFGIGSGALTLFGGFTALVAVLPGLFEEFIEVFESLKG